ncbi:hypothetical protein SDC9_58920 [bioreactor metagenome]|uniref:Uncharacterized protein n=1 Tax=bioreactor metagenome TaxID=1076179 RepID=A0A644X9H9_9ZZZZ
MKELHKVWITFSIVILLILCTIWAFRVERYKIIHSISSNSATGPVISPEDIQELLPEPVWDESHKVRLYTILFVEKQNSIHMAFDDLHIPASETMICISGTSEGIPFACSITGIGNAYLGIVNASYFYWDSDWISGIQKVEVYQRTTKIQDPWHMIYRFKFPYGSI